MSVGEYMCESNWSELLCNELSRNETRDEIEDEDMKKINVFVIHVHIGVDGSK